MIVTLRFFSVLRESFGSAIAEVELEDGTTGSELIELLAHNNEDVNRLKGVVRLAVNDDYVELTEALKEGDEVALLTPVSGG